MPWRDPTAAWRERPQETAALRRVAERLGRMRRAGVVLPYRVPELWAEPCGSGTGIVETDAVQFWRQAVEQILDLPSSELPVGDRGEWTRGAVAYGAFVRSGSAFDHDGDGALRLVPGRPRETGTFLKTLALLPYFRSLGCTVVHLLPVAAIGEDGRKGELGSPYAIRDPYCLDETLAEPVLGLGADIELRALVEGAHWLGMRVVLEFVFRTAAKDSAWVAEHPDWFYWIRAAVGDRPAGSADPSLYGSPLFASDELTGIKQQVARGERRDLPPPHAAYRSLFVSPTTVGRVRRDGARYVGLAAGDVEARIPGAFADWPPDDMQPPWSDVTYLRLYDHADFDYIAYNTVRMYDERLTSVDRAIEPLWDRIAGILPHYARMFGIDGAMIDMGHALPSELKRRILERGREARADFAFWDEDFALRDDSRREGYNAATGSLWWTLHRPIELQAAIREAASHSWPLPPLATPETHNTPRCAARQGGTARSRCLWTLGAFLPAVPFVHGGFELGEAQPVNTGLDFTPEDFARYPTESLPLTSPWAYDWGRGERALDVVRQSLCVRAEFAELVTDAHLQSIRGIELTEGKAVGYCRRAGETVVVVGNPSETPERIRALGLPLRDGLAVDRLGGRACEVRNGELNVELAPWECLVFTERGTSGSG